MKPRRIHQTDFPYFITTKVKGNKSFFDNVEYSELLNDVIINTCKLKGYLLVSFCIMPDHLHLIVWQDPELLITNPARAALPASGHGKSISTVATGGCAGVGEAAESAVNTRAGLISIKDTLPNSKTPAQAALPGRVQTISDLMHGIKSYFIERLRVLYQINDFSWQPSFHFRILSSDEAAKTAIKYIQTNPIKTKLTEKFTQKPYQYLDEGLVQGVLK
ncbi:MAG: transposase [Patescibacteria group bacterium]|jgi:REP element-mobilizing transposase RayT